MNENWITASAARVSGAGDSKFIDAIIERMKVGLIKTWARKLVWDRNGEIIRLSDCEVPE